MERKYLFWVNCLNWLVLLLLLREKLSSSFAGSSVCLIDSHRQGGFQSKFWKGFNTRFWSSWSDHEKRYLQKLGFPCFLWLLPRVHFTRESVLNDEFLEKYCFYCKVLLMSTFPLFKIFIVIHMSNWNRARKYGMLWIKRQYWPLRSHLSEDWPQNTRKVLFELGSNQSKAQAEDLKKLNRWHGKNAFWK